MKISKMNNEQAADILTRIIVPLGAICEDEETTKLIDSLSKLQDSPTIQNVGKIIPQVVLHLLKTHKAELYEIVGALDGKTVAEVAEMNFVQTVGIIRENYDEVLKDFFTSFTKPTKTSDEK